MFWLWSELMFIFKVCSASRRNLWWMSPCWVCQCARHPHALYHVPVRGRTCCFVGTFWWGHSYLNMICKSCLVAWSSSPEKLWPPQKSMNAMEHQSFFRSEWGLGYHFSNFILQFLSREPGELVWVVLGKITAQSVRITCVIRQSPVSEAGIGEVYCFQSPLGQSWCNEHHSSGDSWG